MAVFRALGDPTRLDVYRLIAAQPAPLCVCDIVARFEVSQPTISHHLKILREAGLVEVRPDGKRRLYGLRAEPLAEVAEWLELYSVHWTERLDALERHLEENPE